MKTKILTVSIVALLVFTSATTIKKAQSDLSEKLVGTWTWNTIIDPESKEDLGLDIVTMGMASEIKTEFKKDQTYVESKMRKGTTEYSTTNGEWKIENNETLNLKSKDKWRPSKILKFSNDSLLVQMNPKMALLMIKKKINVLSIPEQIQEYITSQPEPKRSDLEVLHRTVLQIMPAAKLWFLDGKNEEGKVVSNPNIGYGLQNLKYADGKTKDFYKIGLSANTTGISVYILGIKDKKYLVEAYGETIGKASVSGYCIKFKSVKEINLDVLKAALIDGFDR